MPAYCIAANCNNSQATQSITMHEFPRNRPAVRRKWVTFVQCKRADFDAAPICVALSAIWKTLWRNTKWGVLQSGICPQDNRQGYRAVYRITDLQKNKVRISKDEADEQQAHSMIPKIERYNDNLKQALARQRQKSNTNIYGRKGHERKRPYTNACGKERKNKPQMPVAKKERPNHKCRWQTKNVCSNQ